MQRLMFAGHGWRSKDELASDLILWQPQHSKQKRGRPTNTYTYIDQLRDDTNLTTIDEMKTAMEDREGWKKSCHVMDYRASSTW